MLRDALTELIKLYDSRLANMPLSDSYARRYVREGRDILRRQRDALEDPKSDRSKQALETTRALILGEAGGVFRDENSSKPQVP